MERKLFKMPYGRTRAGTKYTQSASSGEGVEEDAAAVKQPRRDAEQAAVRKENNSKKRRIFLQAAFFIDSPCSAPVRPESNWSTDVQDDPGHTGSDWSANGPKASVHLESDCSTAGRKAPVHTESDWSADNQEAPAFTKSEWSADVHEALVQMESDWSANVCEAPFWIASDWTAEALQPSVRAEIDWSEDVPSYIYPRSDIFDYYEIGNLLGKGGFGAVYEGRRIKDHYKVAVKFIKKTKHLEYLNIPWSSERVPKEVALLILANKGPRIPQIIQLLDWSDKGEYFIMVLERPHPCEDLFEFVQRHGGALDEQLARLVFWQALSAAYMSCQRGVFHRDIKQENLLVNGDTLEVTLIDYGCGDLLRSSAYTKFIGTQPYFPPEFFSTGEYHGEPATVYSLGMLLFSLVCGRFPDTHDYHNINLNVWSKNGLSLDCCRLICSCLQQDPTKRIALAEILIHGWF